ncbi:hypothetical protein [Scytonema hofmannii]|uniref:hypothetical protein n=1 Tax=Scytonema hofmannii TaxID=34078 RepID=UPI00034BB532|nr:hypothetical protein [Scytonema hofmannii]
MFLALAHTAELMFASSEQTVSNSNILLLFATCAIASEYRALFGWSPTRFSFSNKGLIIFIR